MDTFVLENMTQVDLSNAEAEKLVKMGFIVWDDDYSHYATTALLWDDFNLPSEDQLLLVKSVLLGLR